MKFHEYKPEWLDILRRQEEIRPLPRQKDLKVTHLQKPFECLYSGLLCSAV